MTHQSKSIVVERKNERRPFKPKAWSHQDELKMSIGKTVRIFLNNGDQVLGRLVAADAYTIRVSDKESVLTYFKHAMTGYIVVGRVVTES